jgi:hypothetical protein
MLNFSTLSGGESLAEVLGKLCEAQEFAEVVLRNGEKKTLNSLNHPKTGRVRFKLAGKVKTPAMKVNILIQGKKTAVLCSCPYLFFCSPLLQNFSLIFK